MSGYDPATGVYELTVAEARERFGEPFMERNARLLAREGLEVLFVTKSYLLVRARPGAIATALDGKPSTWEDHDEVTTPRRYTATYLAHLVKPPMTANAFNKLLEAAGLSEREGREWLLTAAGKPYGTHVVAIGKETALHWDLAVLDVLGLHWPKPG